MLQRISFYGTLLLQLALVVPATAQAPEGNTVKDPLSYFLGISVGQQMGQSGFQMADLDVDQLLLGFQDGIQGKPPALTEEQLTEARTKIQTLLEARQQQQQAAMAQIGEANRARGVQFLAENAKKEGVKMIEGDSGIQFKELKAGTGASPKVTDTVRVHYTGTLTNGTKFDSSVDRGQPATFPLNRVIQGWQIAIAKMKVGAKWIIYIPSDLAYGAQGSPPNIGPNEVLIFEVELLGIE